MRYRHLVTTLILLCGIFVFIFSLEFSTIYDTSRELNQIQQVQYDPKDIFPEYANPKERYRREQTVDLTSLREKKKENFEGQNRILFNFCADFFENL
jgi:hypothetical protein